MDRKASAEIFPKKEESIRFISKEDSFLPPWLFQNRDLTDAFKSADTIEKEALINTLNHIHFMDGYVLVHLRHPKYDESILVKAHPEPCLDTKLICHWSERNLSGVDLVNYQFLQLIIDDGQSVILVPAVLQEMDRNRLTLQIPQTSYAVGKRQARRYACHEVDVELIQSGFLARGELLDFNPAGFRIRVKPETPCSFRWFNSNELMTIHFRKKQQIIFSGSCHCVRQHDNLEYREIVLAPVDEKINRDKKRQLRNTRRHLTPSPTLVFEHPLLKRRIQLQASGVSTSGFSVYEKADEGVLIPGMIIPELIITFAGTSRVKCTAKVIYRLEERECGIRCGIGILDMDVNAYGRLAHIITNSLDPHAYISSNVDMDDLWEFFFESGFIYPMKYRLMQSHREDFKETYRKLYQERQEIARHFTYEENGRIYGHISMVRAYERAWMIQHHAARTMGSKRAGLTVLKQTMHYLHDMYRLPSANMDYVMVYFQPNKKFPDRIFGDFTRALNNPKGCSMDLFSYLPYPTLSLGTRLREGWSLKECSNFDLWKLNRFYDHYSGGLLLDALRLGQEISGGESLEEIYGRLGFLRKWKAYSLTYKRELNAVLIVNQSDLGLNMSEALNGIKILVANPEGLPWDILSIAIGQLAPLYNNTDKVPILIYPMVYVDAKRIPYEKQYQLWVYDGNIFNQFMEYVQKKFRAGYWQ